MRVARCLNLIAGDGETNVLHLNSLDWTRWDETVKDDDWRDAYGGGWDRLRRLRADKGAKGYRGFGFDILMANPPFAGDIKQGDMLASYDLAHKPNGKLESAVGRDLLFIERNLDLLRPSGRMAVVLPQGRFNNSSDKRVREFIMARCRVLAVVGLHPNTFKPHTGTKTSVLFVQKWNDDPNAGPCARSGTTTTSSSPRSRRCRSTTGARRSTSRTRTAAPSATATATSSSRTTCSTTTASPATASPRPSSSSPSRSA